MIADELCGLHPLVVRRAAPSSLRMIIRSIVEDARVLDNDKLWGGMLLAVPHSDGLDHIIFGNQICLSICRISKR